MAIISQALFSRPAIGPVALDAVIKLDKSVSNEYSRERIATGADVSDHSTTGPRQYVIQGGVSNLPSSSAEALATGGLEGLGQNALQQGGQILDSLVGTNFNTRRRDAEEEINALVAARRPFHFTNASGRYLLIPLGLTDSESYEVGDSFQFTLRCREVQVAGAGLLAQATETSTNLVGSGTKTSKGATRTTAGSVEL